MIEVITLAAALSMDAFAISIGLGSKQPSKTLSLALISGVYFGIFQALMPIIGYLGGKGVMGWVESYAPYIAFVLLVAVGGKMIYESFAEGIEEDITIITHRVMLTLAIATSIDALAAGFTLTLLDVNPLLACMIIGITTFCFSFAGVYVGTKSGTWLESKAELLGGGHTAPYQYQNIIVITICNAAYKNLSLQVFGSLTQTKFRAGIYV